jgi:hypothetical protein
MSVRCQLSDGGRSHVDRGTERISKEQGELNASVHFRHPLSMQEGAIRPRQVICQTSGAVYAEMGGHTPYWSGYPDGSLAAGHSRASPSANTAITHGHLLSCRLDETYSRW